jgi:hypothetical protein
MKLEQSIVHLRRQKDIEEVKRKAEEAELLHRKRIREGGDADELSKT